MAKQTIEIEVPEGHKLIKTDKGYEVVPVTNRNIRIVKTTDNDSIYALAKSPDGTMLAYIGNDLAPKYLRHMCIVLDRRFNWKFDTYGGFDIAIPTTK